MQSFSSSSTFQSEDNSPRIAGVIAEYNPFHKGHQFHLEETRKAGADYIVVVMSTCFTQRGDMAILPVRDRVQMALEGGADAVFALPVSWALRDAEHFALGGVSLLDGLGCTMLSFGCETPDLMSLTRAADLLEHPPEEMKVALHTFLQQGLSYPSALAKSACLVCPEAFTVLSSPNNTLSVCYLRILQRLNSRMTPMCILRKSGYLDSQINTGSYSSATAIRAALSRGDWLSLSESLPETSMRILKKAALEGHVMKPQALDTAILCTLRTIPDDAWSHLTDQTEGLPVRVRKAVKNAVSIDDLLDKACTKRYTRARVTRLIMQAFLNLTDAVLPSAPPSQALLLGVRRDAESLLHHLGPITILGKASDLTEPWCQNEQRCWDLWAAGCHLPMGTFYTHGVIHV